MNYRQRTDLITANKAIASKSIYLDHQLLDVSLTRAIILGQLHAFRNPIEGGWKHAKEASVRDLARCRSIAGAQAPLDCDWPTEPSANDPGVQTAYDVARVAIALTRYGKML